MLETAKNFPLGRGTLVEDRKTGRRGRLMDVIIERSPRDGRVVKETVFIRPPGGGREWEASRADIQASSAYVETTSD